MQIPLNVNGKNVRVITTSNQQYEGDVVADSRPSIGNPTRTVDVYWQDADGVATQKCIPDAVIADITVFGPWKWLS
jgi:hypothetical protein